MPSGRIGDREIAKRAAGMNLFGACDPLKSCDLDHVLHPEKNDSVVMVKRRGSIMPTLFDFLYREYCRARLAEMRKQLLVSTASHEVPEANCDVSHPGGSVGRDSDFGDDRTATQHEARHIH